MLLNFHLKPLDLLGILPIKQFAKINMRQSELYPKLNEFSWETLFTLQGDYFVYSRP